MTEKKLINKIYDDAISPAAKEIGTTLGGAVKVALAPINGLVFGYEKVKEIISDGLSNYFQRRNIGKENIERIDKHIAVPIIECLRYDYDILELKEMFINLLGASMSGMKYNIHPSFVEIIKQLSSDEAKIIKQLPLKVNHPILKYIKNQKNGFVEFVPFYSTIGVDANCMFPDKINAYLNNLQRLGLIQIKEDYSLADDRNYVQTRSKMNITIVSGIEEVKGYFTLTDFGKMFCKVCL